MRKLILTLAALSAAPLAWAQSEPSACVDEFGEYTLVYAADLPATHTRGFSKIDFPYEVNRSKNVASGSFDRIGYWLQLTKTDGTEQYVWVSMDAFTGDAALIGVPTKADAVFQTYVDNLHVYSNVDGVRTGTIDQGNIEFWPNSYLPANGAGIPNASDTVYDFGDEMIDNLHGQMEVSDYQNKSVIFNYSGFTVTKSYVKGVGIGNRLAGGRDWTESKNGASYSRRRLEVYVRLAKTGVQPQPLELVSAELVSSRQTVALKFSAPLAETDFGRFVSLDNAVVRTCELCETDPSLLYVRVARVPADVISLNVTVKGLADTSANGNTFAGGSVTRAVTFAGLPSEVVQNVPAADRAGYELVYSWDIPCFEGNYATLLGHIPYDFAQRDYAASYDRVAYYLELTKADGSVQWVWTSMDDWATNDLRKIGVPIDDESSSNHGCYVNNLDVLSNVDGVESKRGITQGNVEFWWNALETKNTGGIPGADDKKFDFGDVRGAYSFSYGQMQVHNYQAKQTVFAINNYCGSLANQLHLVEMGIGNDPNTTRTNYHPDWIFANNADSFTKRVLHVMVRPVSIVKPAPDVVLTNVDEAKDYNLLYTIDIPAANANIATPANYTAMHVVNNEAITQGRSIKRVAYYLELTDASGTQWCWTSFEPWTQVPKRLSLPVGAECLAQQKIANLNVRSNVSGIKEVTNCQTGNIEWFPFNSAQGCVLPDIGGSGTYFDWNDTPNTSGSANYASLQVHNWGAEQTLISVGHLNGNSKVSIGIGNRPGSTNTDWTFADNAASFTSRKLHILVQLDEAGPSELVRAVAAADRRHVCVEFADKVSGDWSAVSTWSLANGPDVIGVRISPIDEREVVLTLSDELQAGVDYELSGRVGAVAVSTTAKVAGAAEVAIPSAVASAVSDAGNYRVIKFVDAPTTLAHAWGMTGVDYDCDESRFAALGFDRVAYLVQVDTTDGSQWVWTSMDAYTKDAAKLGPSSLRRQNEFVCYVDNLKTACGSSGSMGAPDVVAGESAKGNLEMVWSNYAASNKWDIAGADNAKNDFGDTCTPGDAVGWACFSVNDYLNRKTVFNISHFGTATTQLSWGLGNQSTGHPDWTFNNNAANFTRRRLWVLVRASTGAGPVFTIQPQSKRVDRDQVTVLSASAGGAVQYQWRKNGVELLGETNSTLAVPAGKGGHVDTYDVIAYGADGAMTVSEPAQVTTTGGLSIILR